MAPLATAYSGPPKLTLATAFTQWRLDVPMLVLIVALGTWYLWSARQVSRQAHSDSDSDPDSAPDSGRWRSGRTFAFTVLGLGFLLIATMAWPGAYEGVLFYARATQTVLLVLVVPLFLAMGKPLTLLSAAQPKIGRPVERACAAGSPRSPRSPRLPRCCSSRCR